MHSFRFGETSLAFESTDEVWLSYLDRRYGAFTGQASENQFTLVFEPTTMDPPEQLTSPLSTCLEKLTIEASESGFSAETATTHAVVDLVGRRTSLTGPRAMYPLDNLLRHLLPALGEQGALVHGASLIRGERGVLACGPSGAGKTTLASLSGPNALCDELSAVYGRTDACRLTSLPFWQARPGTARLEAVLMLEHGRGQHHRLARIDTSDALKKLSRQVLWPVELPRAMERAFSHLSMLLRDVPVFELEFLPRPDAWQFIEEQLFV